MLVRFLIVCGALISSFTLHAATDIKDTKSSFFLGYGYDISSFKNKSPIDVGAKIKIDTPISDYASRSFFGGYKWNRFGLQVMYSKFQNVSYNFITNNSYTYATTYQHTYNTAIDGLYFRPISKRITFKGLLGLGYLKTSFTTDTYTNGNITYKSTTNGIGARVGAGLQIYLINNCFIDLSARYQAPGNGVVKDLITGNASLVAYF